MSDQVHPPQPQQDQQKLLCGILGILFGGFGVHRFLLGDVPGGLIRIGITIVTCGLGAIIGLIEGIIYLTKTDEEFHQVYVVEKKGWF